MHFVLIAAIVFEKSHQIFAKYGEISEQMCNKYSEAVYEDEPNLGISTGSNKVSTCGIVAVPLIIGGEKTHEREFPHFTLIGFGSSPDEELKWICGGSLISENFVLSAAHCSSSSEFGPAQQVKLGMTTLSTKNQHDEDDDIIQKQDIKEIIKHPLYKKPAKYNDIALFRLRNDVEFTGYVRPACLNTKPILKEHSAIAIGFGLTSMDNEEGSNTLMKVTLDLMNREKCKTYFPISIRMKEGFVLSMICGGIIAGHKDTCQGDSGGPLQIILEKPYCMYSIVGVTSFGRFCGYKDSPAIYTNVSNYIPWIESNVWQ